MRTYHQVFILTTRLDNSALKTTHIKQKNICLKTVYFNNLCSTFHVITSSAVDCGFEPGSDQTKDYKIGICCFSAKQHWGERAKTSWLGIRIMCQSGATCLFRDCCFSELALWIPVKSVGLEQSESHHHHLIENLLVLTMI